jgi:hypothetical protein
MKYVSVFLFLLLSVLASAQSVIPTIDPATKIALRKIYLLGKSSGNRPAVFIKVGDSITSSKFFFIDIGCGIEDLDDHREVASTIRYFREITFPSSYTESWCGVANSFSRTSVTADHGWTAMEPLTKFPNPVSACPPPNDNPLRCEMSLLKPSIALVMYGTNDLEFNALATFRKNLTRVIQEIQAAGVVPVLSTIPPRLDSPEMGRRVEPYNETIAEVAQMLQTPLWNYWQVLQGPRMIQFGIDKKGIHPSTYNTSFPAIFTSEALRYGYNQRNLTGLQTLDKVRFVIQNNAAADENTPSNFAVSPGKLRVTAARGTSVKFFVRVARHRFTQTVGLALEGAPGGVTGTFDWNASKTGAFLTLDLRNGVGIKDHLITIRGTASGIIRKAVFVLSVTEQ